tara:strand:- start:25 stop:180 length:156 start_codon:yes stop_codon:yes gene_type:complete
VRKQMDLFAIPWWKKSTVEEQRKTLEEQEKEIERQTKEILDRLGNDDLHDK